MDLGQKYIEENRFHIEEWFADKMVGLPFDTQTEIIYSIAINVHSFPLVEGWTQEIFGVVKEDHLFYALEYLNEKNGIPIICDINFIESDEYLDAILNKNTIESYEIKIKKTSVPKRS